MPHKSTYTYKSSFISKCFSIILVTWLALGNTGAIVLLASIDANTLPTGANVVHGGVIIDPVTNNTLTINQNSSSAIINWNSFSVGNNAATVFKQVNASAAVLNRVTGSNISEIYGTIQSNGKVYLINENGIAIGASGMIDTNGFVASTHDIANSDFLDGNHTMKFVGNSHASITNEGTIDGNAGNVFIIAREIINKGTIKSDQTVGLAADMEVLLVDADQNKEVFVLYNHKGMIDNKGRIEAAQVELQAAGGNIYALAINNEGLIRATSSETVNGRVILTSNGKIQVSGTIATNDSKGGNITISSNSTLTLNNNASIQAIGSSGLGGNIDLTGKTIYIPSATIDASGHTGGGQIRVGGEHQGGKGLSQDELMNTKKYTVLGSANLKANATGYVGDGGTIILWSDRNGIFDGNIETLPGTQGGNGGFIEVSSNNNLLFKGQVSSGGGKVLIDARNLNMILSSTISAGIYEIFAGNNVKIKGNGSPSVINGNVETYIFAGKSVIINADIVNPNNYSSRYYLEANSNLTGLSPSDRSDGKGNIRINGQLDFGKNSSLYLVIEKDHSSKYIAGNMGMGRNASIKASNLYLKGSSSNFGFNKASNDFDIIAADVKSLVLDDSDGYTVGTVKGFNYVDSNPVQIDLSTDLEDLSGIQTNGKVILKTQEGNLLIQEDIQIEGNGKSAKLKIALQNEKVSSVIIESNINIQSTNDQPTKMIVSSKSGNFNLVIDNNEQTIANSKKKITFSGQNSHENTANTLFIKGSSDSTPKYQYISLETSDKETVNNTKITLARKVNHDYLKTVFYSNTSFDNNIFRINIDQFQNNINLNSFKQSTKIKRIKNSAHSFFKNNNSDINNSSNSSEKKYSWLNL